jgi:hypothetical protein
VAIVDYYLRSVGVVCAASKRVRVVPVYRDPVDVALLAKLLIRQVRQQRQAQNPEPPGHGSDSGRGSGVGGGGGGA